MVSPPSSMRIRHQQLLPLKNAAFPPRAMNACNRSYISFEKYSAWPVLTTMLYASSRLGALCRSTSVAHSTSISRRDSHFARGSSQYVHFVPTYGASPMKDLRKLTRNAHGRRPPPGPGEVEFDDPHERRAE